MYYTVSGPFYPPPYVMLYTRFSAVRAVLVVGF